MNNYTNKTEVLEATNQKSNSLEQRDNVVIWDYDGSNRPVITLQMIVQSLMYHLQKPMASLKHKFWTLYQYLFVELSLPWFKFAVLGLMSFFIFKKDMSFNIGMKSPFAMIGMADEDEDKKDQDELSYFEAKVASYKDGGNLAAPLSASDLHEQKSYRFIHEFADLAQTEMKKYGVLASIKMAQALIESRSGTSTLAVNNKNHFGMKCFSKSCKKGHCSNLTDDHHKDFFRKYDSPWESWRAHSELLKNSRYKKLSSYGLDYKKWAQGLKDAGYATDKKYASKLINVIEKYKLYKLDKI